MQLHLIFFSLCVSTNTHKFHPPILEDYNEVSDVDNWAQLTSWKIKLLVLGGLSWLCPLAFSSLLGCPLIH